MPVIRALCFITMNTDLLPAKAVTLSALCFVFFFFTPWQRTLGAEQEKEGLAEQFNKARPLHIMHSERCGAAGAISSPGPANRLPRRRPLLTG